MGSSSSGSSNSSSSQSSSSTSSKSSSSTSNSSNSESSKSSSSTSSSKPFSSMSSSKTTHIKFADLSDKLKTAILNNKEIKKIFLLKSPVENKVGQILSFEHYEVMFEFDLEIVNYYVLMSFGGDGLEVVMSEDKDRIISRRENNKVDQEISGSFNSSKIKTYLDENSSKNYDLSSYNCQHFANGMIKALKAT